MRPNRGKPNTRVTSRKVDTVSFVSIADEAKFQRGQGNDGR
jgi:hypothetical protein